VCARTPPASTSIATRSSWRRSFTHYLFDETKWPPTECSHDRAISVEAKFVAGDHGLRNRVSILTETPGHPTFERRIYAQYAYILSLLEYTNAHAREMQKMVVDADKDTVDRVLAQAESGQLRNFVEGKYESRGRADILAYRTNDAGQESASAVRQFEPWARARIASGRRQTAGSSLLAASDRRQAFPIETG
jgi:hypothetical protein